MFFEQKLLNAIKKLLKMTSLWFFKQLAEYLGHTEGEGFTFLVKDKLFCCRQKQFGYGHFSVLAEGLGIRKFSEMNQTLS